MSSSSLVMSFKAIARPIRFNHELYGTSLPALHNREADDFV